MTLDKRNMQLLVVGVVVGLWAIGVIVAAFNGVIMLRAMTPVMTLVFGWLFAARMAGP